MTTPASTRPALTARHVATLSMLFAVLLVLNVSSAAHAAAPSWGITSTHLNPYGQHGGVDPYSGSATSFARDSGFNSYTITVTNTSATDTAGTASTGQAFRCSPNPSGWNNSPTSFAYQWLHNGVAISGATSATYTVVAADAGMTLQCQVTAINAGGSSVALATASADSAAAPIVVGPAPATALPTQPANTLSAPTVGGTGFASGGGGTLTCNAGSWTGTSTFSYTWLRNGTVIATTANSALTSNTYTLTAADVATAAVFQCVVAGNNAAGSLAMASANRSTAAPAPVPSPTSPAIQGGFASKPQISGSVTVADRLPSGLTLNAVDNATEASGTGWTCAIGDSHNVTCGRSDLLAPGASYPPIVLHANVASDTADSVTNTASVSGGGASPSTASVNDPTAIAPAVPFGIQSFTTSVTDAFGNPLTQAGGHPRTASTTFVLNYTTGNDGSLKVAGGMAQDVEVDLPPGFIGNPQNAPLCPLLTAQVNVNNCPANTAVGYISLALVGVTSQIQSGGVVKPFASPTLSLVYNVQPPPGTPAMFGVQTLTDSAFLYAKLRSDGDYGITIGAPALAENGFNLLGSGVSFCTGGVVFTGFPGHLTTASCATPAAGVAPLLTNPTQCSGGAPATALRVNAYQDPAHYATMTSYAGAPSASPATAGGATSQATPVVSSFVTGCDQLAFDPSITFTPTTTQADAPQGLGVEISVPQTNDPAMLATPALKDATVTLPEGVTVSPAAADGLQGCSDDAGDPAGDQAKIGSLDVASCPDASQIGSVTVETPLLSDPITGEIYLIKPHAGDFAASGDQDGTFRLMIQAHSDKYGIVIKLPGTISADKTTGQLTATFKNNPQLPFSNLHLQFKGGDRAPLVNPLSCGTATTSTVLSPWSTPYTPNATPSSSFTVDWDGQGGACPATLPFDPKASAGTVSPQAGGSSPFVFDLTRGDRQDVVSGLTVQLPTGLLGAVKDVPLCSDADANAGTCPATSKVGNATVASGPGGHPFWISGQPVSLTGPYKGAPYGLAIAVRAIAGPFDLGTVVVRQQLQIDPTDAHVAVVSDPLPTILDGVPLQLRDIHVDIDRQGFMQAPTNCDAKAITADVTGLGGEVSHLSTPYQATGCDKLPFAPKIAMAFTNRSQVHKRKKPGLDFRLSQQPGEANIKSVTVKLPRALVLDVNGASGALCEVAQAENGTCPASSIVGHATAVTPLLDQPLTGNVYFVRGDNALPNIMVALRGQISINLRSKSKVDKMGRLISTFGTVPDAPISQFHLTLRSAGHGVLSVAPDSDLCTGHNSKGKVSIAIVGQNGKRKALAFKMRTPCKKARKHKR